MTQLWQTLVVIALGMQLEISASAWIPGRVYLTTQDQRAQGQDSPGDSSQQCRRLYERHPPCLPADQQGLLSRCPAPVISTTFAFVVAAALPGISR